MKRITPALLLASALVSVAPVASSAQGVVQPLPGTTDADALADQMRRITANPQDVAALAAAGELSLKLDDLSGAASLFARAEKIDPRNGRVKAGEASLLLRSERPGEALRYFSQAESYGYIATRYAADRGLAYDLIGQQERAQRDYRTALKGRVDDETVRRYALSLGISGRKDEALEQLAPLLRRQDRGAWRARAFVLAMDGDVTGASRIATTMMPPGMAQGLQPFFERLPSLPAADRAFAVHFGEVRPTPERLADARLTPTFAPLAPEPGAPVRVAAARLVVPVKASKSDRRRDRKARGDPARLAAATPVPVAAPVRLAAVEPRPASSTPVPAATRPRYYREEVPGSKITRLIRIDPPSSSVASATRTAAAPVATVSAAPSTGLATVRPAPPAPIVVPARQMAAVTPRPFAPRPGPVATSPPVASIAIATPPAATLAAAPPVVSTPVTPPSATVAAPVVATAAPATRVAAAPSPVVSPVVSLGPTPQPVRVATATPRPGFSSLPDAAVAAAPVPSPVRRDGDSLLAKIVAGLSVPASELDVTAPTRPAARRSSPIAPVAQASTDVPRSRRRGVAKPAEAVELASLDDKPASRRRAGGRKAEAVDATEEADAPPLTRAEKRAAARKATRKAADEEVAEADVPRTPVEKRAAARKTVADKKALTDKKATADKKALADKEAAEEKKAAKSNPERIWVQVSGGANQRDLTKAYTSVKAKAPDAFAGRAAYATPLRATNRVLTGPFKTDAEARAFVNQLAKKGVSAFTFTSDKGQKVERLGSKSSDK